MQRERVVVVEGLDEREIPLREPVPPRQLGPIPFAGTGAARGEYADYEAAGYVEYLAPKRRAA